MAVCDEVPAPESVAYTTAVISVVFAAITSPGNFLVCLAFSIDPYNKLRSPFNLLILNLALADLSVGLIAEPLSAVQHFREALRLDFKTLQKIHHYIYFITCTASILSLAALTAERYATAVSTNTYRARQTLSNRRYLFTSVGIWVLAVLLSGFYFLLGPLKQSIVFSVIAVAVTLVILIFTYLRIFTVLRAQTLLHKGKLDADNRNKTQNKFALKVLEREKKHTKVFSVILFCYISCFIPACAITFLMNYCEICSCDVMHWLRDIQFWLVLLNSVINPFLYALRIPHFRTAVIYILRCRSERHQVTHSTVSTN